MRLYGTVDGAAAGLLGAHEGAVTGVSFHPNNVQLATSGADGTLRLWQLPIAPSQQLAKHTAAINAVAVTSDGLLSLSGGSDKFVHVLGCQNPVSAPYWNITVPEPTGVVGVVCPQTPALLSLVSMMAPVIASGCTGVVISPASPAVVSVFGEVCATSDLRAAVEGKAMIVAVVPSHGARAVLRQVAASMRPEAIVVSAAG